MMTAAEGSGWARQATVLRYSYSVNKLPALPIPEGTDLSLNERKGTGAIEIRIDATQVRPRPWAYTTTARNYKLLLLRTEGGPFLSYLSQVE